MVLDHKNNNEKSQDIKKRVVSARNIQLKRNNKLTNNQLSADQIKTFCVLEESSKNLLNVAASKFNLSARSYFKVLKVSRTIADLSNEKQIKSEHIAEALQYRSTL